MKNVDDILYQEVLKEIDAERKFCDDNNLMYNPNSIWHGTLFIHGRFKVETLLKHQVENMNDFLEYLFEQSEHLDHITYNEAYEEFEVYGRIKLRQKTTKIAKV